MYNLPHYKESDSQVILDFMKEHSFAVIMGVDGDHKPVASQLPFLIDQREDGIYLRAHIMRGNDHHRAFEQNSHVMVLFTGPHTYVSASWYSNTHQGSTWNYMTVQAHGQVRFLPEEALRELLNDLTSHFENNPSSPALYKDIPEEYIARMVKAIVAIEIKVEKLEHVFKLSQNRDEKSYQHIIEQLSKGSSDAQYIAEEMKKRQSQLFPA
jgi:transcriptional regulator